MEPDEKTRISERQQTDESLRVERDKVDRALGDQLAGVDEAADAVISLARTRADQVLAAARAKTDRRSASAVDGEPPALLAEQRVAEDDKVQQERDGADDALRAERAAVVAGMATERSETDRYLLSERERSDDSVATRDEFLGMVSHDLLNLLNTIVLYSTLVSAEVQRADHVAQVTKHAQGIQRAGGRMKRLIGDLVDVASIEAGALAVTRESSDPGGVVSEAVASLQEQASTKNISLGVSIAEPLSPTSLDPARIHQVLVNLISNAIKFTASGGVITVHAARVSDELQITVRDTGIGIPSDKLEAIFDRFVQVRKNDQRGVGLGLYISKCIVQGHGGRIWAESDLNSGTAVHFTLPAAA
jgi:signal transduction histidine kinase